MWGASRWDRRKRPRKSWLLPRNPEYARPRTPGRAGRQSRPDVLLQHRVPRSVGSPQQSRQAVNPLVHPCLDDIACISSVPWFMRAISRTLGAEPKGGALPSLCGYAKIEGTDDV